MNQVGYRMVGADGIAVSIVDLKRGAIADLNRPFNHFAAMDKQAVKFAFGIGNFNFEVLADNLADIADLSAAFAVERGLVGEQIKFAAADTVNRLIILNQSCNLSVGSGCRIA